MGCQPLEAMDMSFKEFKPRIKFMPKVHTYSCKLHCPCLKVPMKLIHPLKFQGILIYRKKEQMSLQSTTVTSGGDNLWVERSRCK